MRGFHFIDLQKQLIYISKTECYKSMRGIPKNVLAR